MTSEAPRPSIGFPARSVRPSGWPAPARWFSLALSVGFLAVLLVVDLDLLLGLDPNPSPLRETKRFPRPHLDRRLLQYPGELRQYMDASMGFRGALVRAHGLVSYYLFGTSPAKDTVIRADPWLFMRSEGVLEQYRNVSPFTPAELEHWREVLEARRAFLQQRNVPFLVVIAPNKETIYADAMPAWATREPVPSRREALVAYLAAHSSLEVLDLTATVLSLKGEGPLYYRTDTHWNDRAARVAALAVGERLLRFFPGTRAPESAWTTTERRVLGGDLARICGLKADLLESIDAFEPRSPATILDGSRPIAIERLDIRGARHITTRAPGAPLASALVSFDSFGEAMLPWLARYFERATWNWTYDLSFAEIEREAPAVVIQELVERELMTLDPAQPPP
jgi:hypothetical protein